MSEADLQAARQALFSQAYEGLARQGFHQSMNPAFSEDESPVCAYRGEMGRRCAIGHLIPDEVYTPDMEGARAPTLLDVFGESLPIPTDEMTVEMLNELQKAHDHYGLTPNAMRCHLADVASRYGLTVPEVSHVDQ